MKKIKLLGIVDLPSCRRKKVSSLRVISALERANISLIVVRSKSDREAQRKVVSEYFSTRALKVCVSRLLVHNSPELALEFDADGVHLSSDSDLLAARLLLGKDKIIGVSAHNIEELKRAEKYVDYATYSPVFETASKPGYGPILGLERLQHAIKETNIPIFALAGVMPEHVDSLAQIGVSGIAVMGPFCVFNAEKAAKMYQKEIEKWI